MTPEQKAKLLVNKYFKRLRIDYCVTKEEFFKSQAKQCALIAVDELIEVLNVKQGGKIHNQMGFIDFWQEVKQEIEKL